MANELICVYPTGSTLYAHLFDATGQIYNGSTFEAPSSGNWATYPIAMTEAATATQIYRASMPSVASGAYSFHVRKQSGGSPAVADIAVATGEIQWDGANVLSLAGISSEIAALNDLSAAQVNAEVDTALADYDPPTKAEMDSGFAGMPTAIDIAGSVLKRDWTVVTGEADRSLLNALRFLRNKWSISGTTLTVTKEDDTTTAWTGAISVYADADPVVGIDPT